MLSKLDDTDRKILHELQCDGRLSNIKLSKKVHLSPTPCLERVKRLERTGTIQSYHARVDPQTLSAGLQVFVQIVLDRTTPDVFQRFAATISELPEVMEAHMIAGGFDYLLKIRAKDMDHYRQFLGHQLAALPGVLQTHTYIVMEQLKSTQYISPFEAGEMGQSG